eukprot:319313-Amphidinium_carterae.1
MADMDSEVQQSHNNKRTARPLAIRFINSERCTEGTNPPQKISPIWYNGHGVQSNSSNSVASRNKLQ